VFTFINSDNRRSTRSRGYLWGGQMGLNDLRSQKESRSKSHFTEILLIMWESGLQAPGSIEQGKQLVARFLDFKKVTWGKALSRMAVEKNLCVGPKSRETGGASPEQEWGQDMPNPPPPKSCPETGRSRTVFLLTLGLHVPACTWAYDPHLCHLWGRHIAWRSHNRVKFLSPCKEASNHLAFLPMQMKHS
jgi:hypothetical protein